MLDLWSIYRPGPRLQTLRYGYEMAGLAVRDEPIPWNAEAVLVEAVLTRVPPSSRKTDFRLRLAGQSATAEIGRPQAEGELRLLFSLAPPAQSGLADLRWQNQSIGQVTLPVLSRDDFVRQLRLTMPTVFVKVGDRSVACQSFVSTQCRGLFTTALLTSPTSLAPLADLSLEVEFLAERSRDAETVPITLAGSQRTTRQALLSATAPKPPRRAGSWLVTWRLGDLILSCQRVRSISARQFQRSLKVADTRFVVQTGKGPVTLQRSLAHPEYYSRVGPCFILVSQEAGIAGMCPVAVSARLRDGQSRPMLDDQILISDGPTLLTPGTIHAGDLSQVRGFELRVKETRIGMLSLDPAPEADFTAEGGFRPPDDYFWTSAAEQELASRLGKLTEGS